MHKLQFISIIIPAYNESRVIRRTLETLTRLDYPLDRFEVYVVENGSTDNTYTIAKEFCDKHKNFSIIQSKKGVSCARNLGMANTKQNSDWIVFLDADTLLLSGFLHDLDTFTRGKEKIGIGTTEIHPLDSTSLKARWWFKFYDFSHKLTHTSYSIQIARGTIARKISYKEHISLAEDLEYILAAKKYTSFFFLSTRNVATSTRRFDDMGYVRLLLFWVFFATTPNRVRKHIGYKDVR